MPSTKVMVSPRIGFNWDVLKDNTLRLRGGSGLFTGRILLYSSPICLPTVV